MMAFSLPTWLTTVMHRFWKSVSYETKRRIEFIAAAAASHPLWKMWLKITQQRTQALIQKHFAMLRNWLIWELSFDHMHVKTMNAHSVLKISKKSHFYFSFLYVLSFGARIQMSFIRKRCLEKNKPQLLKVQTNVMLHTTDQKLVNDRTVRYGSVVRPN